MTTIYFEGKKRSQSKHESLNSAVSMLNLIEYNIYAFIERVIGMSVSIYM